MKSGKLTAILIMIVLVVVSLGIGAHKGWSGEKEMLESAYKSYMDAFTQIKETSVNTLTVASRHLSSENTQVKALSGLILECAREGSQRQIVDRYHALITATKSLFTTLKSTSSLQKDERDSMYVNALLPQSLDYCINLVVEHEYNDLAKEYNKARNTNFVSSFFASLLGVSKPEIIPVESLLLGEGSV